MAVSADNERNTARSSVLMALLNVKRVTVYSIFKVLCVKHAVPSTSIEMWKVAGIGRYRFEQAVIASDTKGLRKKVWLRKTIGCTPAKVGKYAVENGMINAS